MGWILAGEPSFLHIAPRIGMTGKPMQQSTMIPLVIDLDGTLIKSDLLVESFLALLSRHPVRAFTALAWIAKGKAAFKARIAEEVAIDCGLLPVNKALAQFIAAERAAGRKIFLASASTHRLVDSAARALGPFEGFFASDQKTNLSGTRKAEALQHAFGLGGFDYAGNAHADIPVWKAARDVIVVGAGAGLTRKTKTQFPNARYFPAGRPSLHTIFRALRLHQWLKNLLIFAAALASHHLSPDTLFPLLLGFLSFGLCASSAYLANDLLDLQNDRSHVSKRERPLASGRMPLWLGITLAPLLLIAGLLLAIPLPPTFLALLGFYYLLTTTYSLFLKQKMILDVLTLACLYWVRLVSGSVITGVPLSAWFLTFLVFLFLCLAIVKRCTEILDRGEAGAVALPGRGYIQRDLPILEAMAAATGYVAIMVFALYIDSAAASQLYRQPLFLWAICPVLFYWLSRILLLMHRGEMHEDPVVYAISDRASLVCGALVLMIAVAAV